MKKGEFIKEPILMGGVLKEKYFVWDKTMVKLDELRKLVDAYIEADRELNEIGYLNTSPRVQELKSKITELSIKIKETRIEFGCGDYGDTHCLCIDGLKHVLDLLD